MKAITIMDLIDMDSSKHNLELSNKINANTKYRKAQEEFSELINSLETQMKLDIESAAVYMEAIATDTAFNEGFKLAIQLILSSIQ